jgi:hypothetical protein
MSVDNDPVGAFFNGSVTPSLGGQVVFDNGRLTLSESITQVNANSAWAVFHVNATNGQALVGNPAAHFNITISGIQTNPATLFSFFAGFDVNGVDDPFPFSTTTIGPNPITGTGSVANGVIPPANYSFITSQQLYADLNPYDQGPKNFGNSPENTPTGFTIGGLYQLQTSAVPEPSSLTLVGVGVAGAVLRRGAVVAREPR